MHTVIFDIDGTIADISARRGFLQKPKRDWKSFHAGMENDVPNLPVVSLYKALWFSRQYQIILVTGRLEQQRKVTERWLKRYDIPFSRMEMRSDLDYRADHIIKEEILKKLQAEGCEIIFTVDDRQQVVDMWRRNGITCLQCDVGDF